MILRHLQKQIFILVLTCLVAFTVFPSWTEAAEVVLDVYFFHSETCPHCAHQMPLMESIEQHNDEVDVHFIEVHRDPQTWQTFRERYHIASSAVPRTFVGEKSFVGYSESDGPLEYAPVYSGYIGYRNQILQAIAEAIGHEVHLSATVENLNFQFPWWTLGLPFLYVMSFPLLKSQRLGVQAKRYWLGGLIAVCLLSLFIIVNLTPDVVIQQFAQNLPFPLFVSTIALADGFNPCAFTVLIILLSLLTYTKQRRDMALIGGTFITTSAVMYFLFIMLMVGLGSILLEQYGKPLLLVLGSGIAIAGLINIKDYFWFKQGVSLSLSDAQQRTISRKASQIVRDLQASSGQRMQFLAALGGTVVLAVMVNIVELGCTAILPMVYMTTLVNYCETDSASSPIFCYITWTALYAIVYIVPLLLILLNFIYSFQSSRFTETQGRRLKLLGGVFMLVFGLVMILQPNLLMLR